MAILHNSVQTSPLQMAIFCHAVQTIHRIVVMQTCLEKVYSCYSGRNIYVFLKFVKKKLSILVSWMGLYKNSYINLLTSCACNIPYLQIAYQIENQRNYFNVPVTEDKVNTFDASTLVSLSLNCPFIIKKYVYKCSPLQEIENPKQSAD